MRIVISFEQKMRHRILKHILAIFCIFFAIPSDFCWGGYLVSDGKEILPDGKNVTGVVTDDSGEPLAGAMVYIKGTTVGVQTDLDGRYSIKAPGTENGYVLVFQYLGMTTKEIPVKKTRVLNVTLTQDNELEGSVVTGAYGLKQRREDLVGSAFQVNSEALKNKPKARIDNILQGLVPGMTVQPNADYAGTTRTRYETRIRGESSLSASSEPIWIVDGMRLYTGGTTNIMPGMSYTVSPLSFLNPDDIESITVLKDADQTALYGADGGNGVIIVTTKSGRRSSPLRTNLNVSFGVAAPDYSTMFKTMNAAQYLEVAREAWKNAGYNAADFPYQDNDYNSYSTTDTDWARTYLGLGTELNAGLSLSSGSEKVSNYVSASYYRNTNTIQKDNQQRFSVNSTQDFSLWKGASLKTNLSASYNVNDIFPLSNYYISTLPIFSPYMEDGSYRLYNKVWDSSKGDFVLRKFWGNELPERDYNDNTQKSLFASGKFTFEWEIVKGLKIKSFFAMDYTHSSEEMYSSMKTLDGIDDNGNRVGKSSRSSASYVKWEHSDFLSYDGKFGKHSVSALAGLELRHRKNRYMTVSGTGFSNDYIKELQYASTISQYSSSNVDINRAMSYMARVTYSYDKRYYLAANFRCDGNSVFGTYSQWGPFGSVGASWNIHNEKFFRSEKINMLKLKLSYGLTGNSRISSEANGTYTLSQSYSYKDAAGAVIGTVPNPGLSWESVHTLNASVILGLKNILDVEVEAYQKYTTDMLAKVYVSRTITDNSVYANVGKLSNNGIELSLTTYNFNRKDFQWTTRLNLDHRKNKLLDYNGGYRSFGDSIWMEGYDTSTWYLVRWAGVDPTDGSPMWYDKDGNLTKTYSSDNRVPYKNSTPVLQGGLTNSFRYKNWTLDFQINFNIGGYALATYASSYFNDGYAISGVSGNQAVEIYHYRWTTPGQAATFPKVSETSTKSAMKSTRYLYNKTSFELSNVTLSYSIPQNVLDKMRMRGASISLNCYNLYLLTPDQKKGFNSYKTMKYGYPVNRTFTLALNINF